MVILYLAEQSLRNKAIYNMHELKPHSDKSLWKKQLKDELKSASDRPNSSEGLVRSTSSFNGRHKMQTNVNTVDRRNTLLYTLRVKDYYVQINKRKYKQ